MNSGPAHLKALARNSAACHLQKAATFLESHANSPLFKKRMGKGAGSVLVHLELSGVLKVIEPSTGQVLALSVPGKHSVLSPDFVPVVPALNDEKRGDGQG